MNAELRKAKEHVNQAVQDAVNASYENLSSHISQDYTLRRFSRSVEMLYNEQWCGEERHPDGGWDWIEVSRRYRGPKDILMALESEGRLSALFLSTLSRERVLVRGLEGDPRLDCHMKGVRALVSLDFAVTLGQRHGCKEIHLEPINGDLNALYIGKFGFSEGLFEKKPILKKGLIQCER